MGYFMIDYDITVATPDGVEVDLAREPLPEGVTLPDTVVVLNDTGIVTRWTIQELIQTSPTPEVLNERLDNLRELNLSPTDLFEISRNLGEVADNAGDVVVYDDYADWLEHQDYIVDELHNVMPTLADAIIDSIDPELLFDAGDQTSYEVLPSGKILYLAYE